jgi:hypothetical protein
MGGHDHTAEQRSVSAIVVEKRAYGKSYLS